MKPSKGVFSPRDVNWYVTCGYQGCCVDCVCVFKNKKVATIHDSDNYVHVLSCYS